MGISRLARFRTTKTITISGGVASSTTWVDYLNISPPEKKERNKAISKHIVWFITNKLFLSHDQMLSRQSDNTSMKLRSF